MLLDHKQQRLIEAWLGRASMLDGDEYFRFMAAWLAFNAFCYARFASKASQQRPDLEDSRGLAGIEGKVEASGTLELRSDGRIRLQIETPGRIRIDIRDRYTEDIVFAQFARSYQFAFARWVDDPSVHAARDGFLAAILRPQGGHYVVNMLKANDHTSERSFKELVAKNIIVAITDPDDLRQLVDALYQVRCNVFHGEKIPGDMNDDRIVCAARPLVVQLLGHAMALTAQQDDAPDGATRRR